MATGAHDILILDNGIIHIEVDSIGAELTSLRDARGREFLWQAEPVWPRHAPLLFPLVGRMPGDQLEHDGVEYPIGQHGFARDQEFTVGKPSESELVFTLDDSAATRVHFPFGFRLEVRFSLDGDRLIVRQTVTNTGDEQFSASLGAHPGFAWPLLPGIPREDHTIEFAEDEPDPIRRISDGLVLPDPVDSPVVGSTLALDDSLFVDDAIIFDRVRSRSVRYSAPGAPTITVDFEDFPLLGVWSKAPGRFVCIEPWFGMTAPVGFAGEYSAKPHQFTLEPGAHRLFSYSVRVSSEA